MQAAFKVQTQTQTQGKPRTLQSVQSPIRELGGIGRWHRAAYLVDTM